MRTYTPSRERILCEWMRHRRNAGARVSVRVPSSSEEWIQDPNVTIGDLLRIADELVLLEKQWHHQ